MKRRIVTDAEIERAGRDLTDIRQTLEAEARLLMESHRPRLVAYACVTTAIKIAVDSGMTPAQFAEMAADTIGLYCGDKPDRRALGSVIEFPRGD